MRFAQILLLVIAGSLIAAAAGLVDFQVDGDATATFLAVSLRGNSTADWVAVSGSGNASGRVIAASGFGDSAASFYCIVLTCVGGSAASVTSNSYAPYGPAVSLLGESQGYVPIDPHSLAIGVADANGKAAALSLLGDASAQYVAVSALGNASCSGYPPNPCMSASLAKNATASALALSATGSSRSTSFCAYFFYGCLGGVAASGASEANGSQAAVSGLGSATCSPSSAPPCIAASGLGDATACEPLLWLPCIAASAGGNATGGLATSIQGRSSGRVAFSVIGDSTACATASLCSAISVLGNSSGLHAVSVAGNAVVPDCSPGLCEGLAVSVLGSASCPYFPCIAFSGFGSASGGLAGVSPVGPSQGSSAVSILGNATSCSDHLDCIAITGLGNAGGSVAASATGNSSSCSGPPSCIAVSLTGDSRGAVAVSATGHASGFVALSGCDVSGVACVDPV